MANSVRLTALVAALVGLMAGVPAAHAQDDPGYLSPQDIVAAPDGEAVYVVEATAKQVARVATQSGEVNILAHFDESPSGLVLSPDGSRLYVTTGPAGQLHVVDAVKGGILSSVALGYGPCAPVASPDGATVYVCNRFNDCLSVVDAAGNAETARIPVEREPIAAAVTPDGKTLVVANHLPGGASDGDYVAAVVSLIDTGAKSVSASIQLPNGSTGLRGVAVSPEGAYAYVTHILARYHLPTTQLERGWMNTNALSIIDIAGKKLLTSVLLDDVDLGAANPWGVTVTADGAYVCVAHAGTSEISVIDRAALHDKIARLHGGEQVSGVSRTIDDVPNDLSFLVGLRNRIKTDFKGLRGIAVAGENMYAAAYFADCLAVAPVKAGRYDKPTALKLGPQLELTVERKGEMFFNDADLCFQKWQSCASCHPDARADGLNWDLLNDGMGNPKNTKSMVLSHKTPPVMISGVRDKAETAVRSGIRFIQFAVRPDEDADAIDAYLRSLEPLPSPYLEDGKLSEAAVRGKAVYDRATCATCHPEPLYTNLSAFDVGTGKGREADMEFDTPTLCEAWRTGPFLHDGRSATIMDVLTKHNEGDKHGVTSSLNEQELKDLAEYVLSL